MPLPVSGEDRPALGGKVDQMCAEGGLTPSPTSPIYARKETQPLGGPLASGDDVRRIALSLEGTCEAPHFDRAAFKAARIYATLAGDGKTANFKFGPDDQQLKCLTAPEAFAPVSGGWGRRGWTVGTLSALSEAELRAALEIAWRNGQTSRRRK